MDRFMWPFSTVYNTENKRAETTEPGIPSRLLAMKESTVVRATPAIRVLGLSNYNVVRDRQPYTQQSIVVQFSTV